LRLRRRNAALSRVRLDSYPCATPLRPSPRPSWCGDVSLKGQSGLTRAFGNRFDAAVIDESAPVEDDRVNASRFCPLANYLADGASLHALCCLSTGTIKYFPLEVAGRDQRLSAIIIDDLGINVRG
jgi:hypothetical protein